MKTTVNRFFLLSLIVCLLLLAAAVHGLHAFQIGRQSRFLLEEAHRALTEKQYELALNRFQQYVKLAPDDIDALAEYGLLLADRGLSQGAAFMLEKVLREQPDRDDVRRRLATIEMAIGRAGDAKVHLKYLLAKSPADAGLLELRGICETAAGEYEAAASSFKTAIDHDPHQVETYAHLATVLRMLKRPAKGDQPADLDKADSCMKQLVEQNPKSARAHLLAAQYQAAIGHEKDARDQTDRALELAPKDFDSLLFAAQLALAAVGHDEGAPLSPSLTREEREKALSDRTKKQIDKARQFALRAIDTAKTNPAGYIMLARIEAAAGNRKEAIARLEAGAAATDSRDPALLWELARLRIAAGDVPAAQDIVKSLHKLTADDRNPSWAPLIGYLEGEIELANQHWPAAIQRLEQVAPNLDRRPDLQKEVRCQIAACQEQLGNTELQLAAYREAVRVDPAWPPARLGVAGLLLSQGKFDEALEEYRQIAKLDGMEGAGAAGIVKLLIMKNLGRPPAQRDWKEVDTLLEQLLKLNPDSVGVLLLKADALAEEHNPPVEAENLLLAARTKTPERIEIWQALIGLADRQQEWPKAEQLLAEAEQKFGDPVWLRLARGSYLLSRYKREAAPRLKTLAESPVSAAVKTDKAEKAAPNSPADQATLARGFANLSLEAGDLAQATALARQACDADPQNLQSRLFLFDLALRNGDIAAVKQVLAEIRDVEGEGPIWHYGQAAIYMLTKPAAATADETAAAAAAIQHIAAARKLRPDWPALSLLTAQIQDRQGQSGPALQNYLEAINLGERSPVAVRRAVELLYAKQRFAEADQLLRRLDQQPTLFSGNVERMASKVSARLEDLDRALELAGKVAANSHDWRDKVWLGQLQSLVGLRAKQAGRPKEEVASRFKEAEESLRAAVTLKPEAPEPWIALIRFYVAIDRRADAETTIHQAERKLPPETAGLALASSYEAIGNTQEAGQRYDSALAKSAQDAQLVRQAAEFEIRSGKLAEGEAHLRSIVSGQVAAKPDEVAVARRELAAVLQASGKYPKIEEALTLIEQNLAAGPLPEDLREKAFTLALFPQPDRHQAAIDILEKLLDAQPADEGLQAALAQLYLAANNWPRASHLLRSLVTSHEKNPRYLALYAAQLLQHGEPDEAELWIHSLQQIAPQEFATAGLEAEALVKRGQIDSAIHTLSDAVARQKLSPAQAVAETRQVAARLEQLAHGMTGPDRAASAGKLLAEAERIYRKNAQNQPDQQLPLAGFLARHGHLDEALALVETAGPKADPNVLAQVFGELIASGEQGAGSGGNGAGSGGNGAGGRGQEAGGREQEPRAGRRQPPDSPDKATVQPTGDPLAVGGRLEKLLIAAIDQHGRAAPLVTALADLQMQQERFDDAIKTFRESLEKDPANVVAMNNLAMLLALEKQHLDEALQLIDQAIAAVGPLPALLDSRASVYLALGRPGEALTDLNQAIAAEPRPNRQFHRALACYQLGQTEAAAQALALARKAKLKPDDLNPLERPAYRNLVAKLPEGAKS